MLVINLSFAFRWEQAEEGEVNGTALHVLKYGYRKCRGRFRFALYRAARIPCPTIVVALLAHGW